MFGFLKKLFGKGDGAAASAQKTYPSATTTSARPAAAPAPAPAPAAPAIHVAPLPMATGGDVIEVSLRAITKRLPEGLAKLIAKAPDAGMTVALPRPAVLAQLSRGAVRITMGDLRRLAPAGVFSGGEDKNGEPVEIPLAEILPKLRSEGLALRPNQKRVEVPAEVAPIFGTKGQQAAAAKAPIKPAVVVSPPPTTAPVAPAAAPTSPISVPAPPPSAPPPPSPPLPPAPAPAPVPALVMVQEPPPPPPEPVLIKPAVPLPDPASLRPKIAPAPKAAVGLAPSPAPFPAAAPAKPASPAPTLAPGATVAQVDLGRLMASWPDAIRAALEDAASELVFLPLSEMESGLKKGKITVTWSRLKGWMASEPSASIPDEAELELPLSLVAPLFMMARKPGMAKRELKADAAIPDLFGAKAEASAPAPSPTIPAPAVPPAAPAPSPASAGAAKPAILTIGDALGNPSRTEWPPADIVQATANLEGIAGAIVTMHDGFLVAGKMPPEYDLEAFAAFLPELHTRVNRYASDLKLSPNDVITVAIGDIPIRIYRTPSVFLAVLGRARNPLPQDRLAVIVKHLD